MTPFMYRCPITGLRVQTLVPDDPSETAGESFVTIVCSACRQTHLINPKTGKTLGAEDE